MTDWLNKLRRAVRGRYVGALEDALARERDEVTRQRAELDRLREENRAMLNSLLGLAGCPPVETPRPQPAATTPIRRRSWPQFAAAKEFAATRETEAARHQRAREEAK